MSDQLILPFEPEFQLATIFSAAFHRLIPRKPAPDFLVDYREWAQVRSTIRVESPGQVRVEISDVLRQAPPDGIEALAEILIARLYRRRPSRESQARYLACIMAPEIRRHAERARRERGFKRMLPARGRHYDLGQIFQLHNAAFFSGELKVKRIGWSLIRSARTLGHYDPAHDTITISRLLDSAQTPRLLVEYVMFHEMLHARHPVTQNHHRRVIHSAEFRAAEKLFPEYRKAQQLLKSGFGGRGAIDQIKAISRFR